MESGRRGSRVSAGRGRSGWRGAAARVRGGRGGAAERRGGAPAARRARIACTQWSAPFGAGDAKVLYEANSRMTSAEFSAGRQDAVRQRRHRSVRRASRRSDASTTRSRKARRSPPAAAAGVAAAVAAAVAVAPAAIQRSSTTPARCRPSAVRTASRWCSSAPTTRRSISRARSTSPTGPRPRRTTSSTRSTSRPARRRACSRATGNVDENDRRAARRRLQQGHRRCTNRRRWCRIHICAT